MVRNRVRVRVRVRTTIIELSDYRTLGLTNPRIVDMESFYITPLSSSPRNPHDR